MTDMPRDRAPDSTLALLKDGYRFISKRTRRYDSDVFETRLLLRRTICMQSEAAAELFYDNERFQRKGAMPTRIKLSLFGKGGVQGLDGEAHRVRKQLFMDLMNPVSISRLADMFAEEWRTALDGWEQQRRVVLFDAIQPVLSRAVCRWAGVPLNEDEVDRRTWQLAEMVEGSGAVGQRHLQARWARRGSEKWIVDLIKKVRAQELTTPPGSVLQTMAWHRDVNGKLLKTRIAAVEVLNVLRPVVAVGRFIVFAALALHEHPEQRAQLQRGGTDELEQFVQEVRRSYPFFPFLAARVRRTFTWNGYRFPKGRRVLLDIYGTNHDPRLWDEPEQFNPARFRSWNGSAFNFIPQGGGAYESGHRCPGEWITIEIMKVAVHCLSSEMRYEVPRQNLRVSMMRIPSLPRSGFVMRNVRAVSQPDLAPAATLTS